MSKPDFVNVQGTKWWRNASLNEYAIGLGLKNVTCWHTEMASGEKEYVILQNNKPEFSSSLLEHVASHLDIMALQEQTHAK